MNWLISLSDYSKLIEIPIRRYLMKDIFYRIEVETSTTCNNSCNYCPVSISRRPNYLMDEKLFFYILDQLREFDFKGRFSPHFYGEPLLDERLTSFISQTRRKLPKCFIVIYTNGDYLTPQKADELLNVGVNLFIITNNGNISDNLKMTLKNKSTYQKLRYFIVRDIHKNNKLFNRGGNIKLAKNKEIHLKKCISSASKIVIDAWGKVKLCSNDYFGTEDWGDIKQESIKQIWEKTDYVKIRKELLEGKFTKKICRICTGIEKK